VSRAIYRHEPVTAEVKLGPTPVGQRRPD